MMGPKISIIIPTFNNKATISDALNSVVSQSYENIEIIIIDGCSTDNTAATVKKFQKSDPRIKLFVEKDEGIYDAMNKGIDISKGDWLYFMGADDSLYDKNVINDLYKLKAFDQEKVFYGDVIIIGNNPWAKDKTKYDGPFDIGKLLFKNICQQAIFYPRNIVKEIGYFNKNYTITADYDYNLRCYAKQEFLYHDKLIAVFNSGGKSSQVMIDVGFKEFARNIINYFKVDKESEIKKKDSPFTSFLTYYNYLLKTQLNPFNEIIKPGISLITAFRHSKDLSEEVLKSWINQKQLDEIIIVDWNSDDTLLPLIKNYQNGKIILARVESPEKWNITHAYNLAARLSSRDKILKVSSNIKLLPGFIEKHQLSPGTFFANNSENLKSLNDLLLIDNGYFYRDDFFRVSGYSDFLRSYGCEDRDLFSKLETEGLECINFDPEKFDPDFQKRTIDLYKYPQFLKFISGKEWLQLKELMNKHIQNSDYNWFVRTEMPEYKIMVVENKIINCKQTVDVEIKKLPGTIQIFEVEAIKERLREIGIDLPQEINDQLSKDEFIHLYNLYLTKDMFQSYNHLFSLFNKFRNIYYSSIKKKNEDISRQIEENVKKDQVLQLKDISIYERDQLLELKEKNLLAKNIIIEKKDQNILERDKLIEQKDQTIQGRDQSLKEKDKLIEQKDKTIQEKDILIVQKERNIQERNQLLNQRDKHIQEKTNIIDQKDQIIKGRDQKLKERDDSINNNLSEINKYKMRSETQQFQIETIYNSTSWRLGRFITNVISKVFFFLPLNRKATPKNKKS